MNLPELPLLRRELTELANRRRTYGVRVAGAIVILFFVFLAYQDAVSRHSGRVGQYGPMAFMGIGGDIFRAIIPVLFNTISVLLPALCCTSITSEKESNTIGTLLLTRLSPATIVLEKFGSRLVPMLTLLLLTFPVLAQVHTMGGVDTDLLYGTIWLLLGQCFLVAAISIACSSWFATTVGAFVASYAMIGFLIALNSSFELQSFLPSGIWHVIFVRNSQMQMWTPAGMTFGPPGGTGMPMLTVVYRMIPALIVTAGALLFARVVLVRRAFVSQSSLILKIFRRVDSFFQALNERTTGGIQLVKDVDRPPENDPVAWRERSKKSLGKAQYLFRILLVIEGPTLFLCMLAATSSARAAFQGLFVLQGIIWVLCALITAVKASTLMSSERARQTLEALLATPMTSGEILSQKIAGIRRLLIVVSLPILTVNLTHFLLHIDFNRISILNPSVLNAMLYLLLSTVCTFTILYMITWFSAGIGLRVHSQTKAMLTTLALLAGWATLPIIAGRVLIDDQNLYRIFILISPVPAIPFVQALFDPIDNLQFSQGLATIACFTNFVWLLVAIATVRRLAPVFLNRLDGSQVESDAADEPVATDPVLESA